MWPEPIPHRGHRRAIYQTSTYINEELGKNKATITRERITPTAKLWNARSPAGRPHSAYVSLPAWRESTRSSAFAPGDHVVLSEAVTAAYSALHATPRALRLEFSFVTRPCRISCAGRFVQIRDVVHRNAANPRSALRYRGVSKLAGERNLSVVVDNTFLSPICSAHRTGAHIVVHSMTNT